MSRVDDECEPAGGSGAELWNQMRADIQEIYEVLKREQLEHDMHRNVSETGLWSLAVQLYNVRFETEILPRSEKGA